MFDQPGDDAICRALARADALGHIAARQRAAIKHGFQEQTGFPMEVAQADLFFGSELNARVQPGWLNESLHEAHLVQAGLQKEFRETGERFFAQIARAVKIVSPGLVAARQVRLVGFYITGKTADNRPDASGVERIKQW